jgi:hypothetical protein
MRYVLRIETFGVWGADVLHSIMLGNRCCTIVSWVRRLLSWRLWSMRALIRDDVCWCMTGSLRTVIVAMIRILNSSFSAIKEPRDSSIYAMPPIMSGVSIYQQNYAS